jgi:hypothetical protein
MCGTGSYFESRLMRSWTAWRSPSRGLHGAGSSQASCGPRPSEDETHCRHAVDSSPRMHDGKRGGFYGRSHVELLLYICATSLLLRIPGAELAQALLGRIAFVLGLARIACDCFAVLALFQ